MNCGWCGGHKAVKILPEGFYHKGCLQAKQIEENPPEKKRRGRPPGGNIEHKTKKYYEPTFKVNKKWYDKSKESIDRILAKGTNRK